MQVNKQQRQEKTVRQKTLSFYQTVEAGDIALMKILEQAVFFMGFTKAGKTASCHCVCDSPLRVVVQNGQLVYKPSSDTKFPAKVGNITDSETEIPNLFKTRIIDPKSNTLINVVVIDLPGYGDTYGFHRIFSNGYFHYRSFSKTSKIKFVITFAYQDMEANAARFKSTIKNFFNTFKNYPQIKDQILEATSFLVTKVDKDNCNEQSIRKKLEIIREAVTGMGKTQKSNYQQIISRILDKKRFYFIPKPTQVGLSINQNKILQDIYFNSEFWERYPSQNNPNYISMKNINFSVADEIIKKLKEDEEEQEDLFKGDFLDFMNYTQQKVNDIISDHQGSLNKMIQQLQKDALTSNQSKNFLTLMESFSQKFYNFSPDFKEERKKIKSELFRSQGVDSFTSSRNVIESDSSKREKDKKTYYFIKKFDFLSFLVKIYNEKIQQIKWNTTDRTIEQLQETSSMFKKIFQKMAILSPSKNHLQMIHNYSYIIQRLIEEFKIITLILFNQQKHINYFNGQNIMSQDLYRSVSDRFITITLGQINIKNLKKTFIQQVDFNQFTHINEDIIDFFQDLTNNSVLTTKSKIERNQVNNKPKQLTYAQMTNISLRVVGLLKKYHSQISSKKEKQQEGPKQESIYLARKIYEYRNKLYNKISIAQDMAIKKALISNVTHLSKMLAEYFLSIKKYQKARDCYISINDAYSLFEVYEKECSQKKETNQLIKRLLQYGKSANFFKRKDIAMKCYQRAYSLSEDCDTTSQISNKIIEMDESNQEEGSSYIYNLRSGKYCLELPSYLII